MFTIFLSSPIRGLIVLMTSIYDIPDETVIRDGSIFRLYDVDRRSIMKTAEDRSDPEKQKKNYYDFLLVDCSILESNTFLLINITSDSSNRGRIFARIGNINTRNFISGSALKNYFKDGQWYLMEEL